MKRVLFALFAYVCIGTVLAQAIGVTYAWMIGKLDQRKLVRLLAVAHDVELTPPRSAAQQRREREAVPALSYEQIEELRKIKSRDIELRRKALQRGLDQVAYERQQLTKDKEKYALLQESFEERLKELQEETETQGHANVRIVLENVQPKMAKEVILDMVEADEMQDVVHMLSDMPTRKRAKIVSEFSSEAEKEVLDRILRQMREGGAVNALIDEAREQVQRQ